MTRLFPWALAALLMACASTAGAQIVTENAGVISPETPILRESVTVFQAEHIREVRWAHQFIVAPDTSRELKLILPTLARDLDSPAPGGGDSESYLSGVGDFTIRFKQSVWQEDDVMASTRWAFMAEVTAPTGPHHAREDGVEIPRRLQLGAGDWTLGVGSAFTLIRDRHRFSVEAFFRERTRHDGVELGSSAELNLAYWYRLTPARFETEGAATEVRGVLELLTSWRDPDVIGENRADNGGWIVWLAPGIQIYPSRTILLEANVQVPVLQDVDDSAGNRHWGATVAVKILF